MTDAWLFVPIAKLAWAYRIWRLGLAWRWRWLVVYLVQSAVLGHMCNETIARFGLNSVASAWVLPLSTALLIPTLVCVIGEAYENADPQAGRWLFNALLGSMALLAVCFFALLDLAPGSFWIQAEQPLYGFLAALLLAVSCVAITSVDVPWNPAVVACVFFPWFLTRAGIPFLDRWLGVFWWGVDYTLEPLVLGFLMLAGCVLFRREAT